MDTTDEILTILQEECSEVIQAVSKSRRFGFNAEYEGRTNKQSLTQELGDVLALIEIAIDHGLVIGYEVEHAKLAKFERLKQWTNITISRDHKSI